MVQKYDQQGDLLLLLLLTPLPHFYRLPSAQVRSIFSKKDEATAGSASPSSASDSDLDGAGGESAELRRDVSSALHEYEEGGGSMAEDEFDEGFGAPAPLSSSISAAPSAPLRSSSFGGGGAMTFSQTSAMT